MTLSEAQFEFEGLPVTYYRGGSGMPLLLLHGSGPGASSIGNWRLVLEPLAAGFEVFAMDLIGFGKSARKPAEPYFDYGLWSRQAKAMLARIEGEKVGVIGHSLSGSLALTLACGEPRVAGVVTTGSMGAPFTPNEATHRTWTCPTQRADLEKALRGLVYDQSLIDDAYIAAREPVVFAPGYHEYFNTMFKGDQQQYIDAALLSAATLAGVNCEVLMIHGRNDTAFPPDSTLHISAQLQKADAVLLARCSHSVAYEHPAKFLSLVKSFFGAYRNQGGLRA